ncbi:hypothetical protein E1176_04535 [Fulvivirga sp. RKSG066]|uniref:DUF4097 family beta strand repeat-containing protein n=1 Tax=Fulvivirga aurantia TaxID=2529383 RepID=UPI0012BB7940|nr:hypothetical protein [Fulvivirga aurantia]MTI20280.1 hypothetical protein [Fulvivirga aurantia]
MKLYITTILLVLVTSVTAQQHTETIEKQIAFEKTGESNVFYLANINGGIKVEGYDGDKVLLTATKTIKAKTEQRLQAAVQELSIGIMDRLDTILVYINGPCAEFGRGDYKYRKSRSGWSYNWDDCKFTYDFTFDIVLKVPYKLNLNLSTINKGDITVTGVEGTLDIENVNGAISLKGVNNLVEAYTINGDVDIDYKSLVGIGPSSFYTLNGDINANYPQGLKADLAFKSYNGDLYTNIEDISYRPNVMKESSTSQEGVSFKVETKSLISVRGGGAQLDFETFNGNVYIKENK